MVLKNVCPSHPPDSLSGRFLRAKACSSTSCVNGGSNSIARSWVSARPGCPICSNLRGSIRPRLLHRQDGTSSSRGDSLASCMSYRIPEYIATAMWPRDLTHHATRVRPSCPPWPGPTARRGQHNSDTDCQRRTPISTNMRPLIWQTKIQDQPTFPIKQQQKQTGQIPAMESMRGLLVGQC